MRITDPTPSPDWDTPSRPPLLCQSRCFDSPNFGWFAYAPLSDAVHSPGAGPDLWISGLIVAGLGTILGAVNFITTITCLRAPGMIMFRMPIFTWNIFFTSILILLAFPPLTAALFGLLVDRHFGAHVFDPANGGAILWQHLFWFFGHPEVYIVALPFFGIVTEILPVFSRKPLFGYKGMVFATVAITVLSASFWAHHSSRPVPSCSRSSRSPAS